MSNLHIIPDVLAKDIAREPIRKGFGKGLLRAGQDNPQVVAAAADLTESIQMHLFRDAFPDRFVQVGIGEQNLVAVGAGLAAMGKIPFVASYAAFNPGRNWEQIRTTICLNDLPVRVIGGHAGVLTGPDGATHQMLEDIAMMRVLPNMVVIVPGDSLEAERATLALVNDTRPAYLRMARDATPIFTTDKTPFAIGKAYVLTEGSDITMVTTGAMTYEALVAAEKLYKQGIDIEVVHCPTIKPLDAKTIVASAQKTHHVIVAEEAQIIGGLGGAVAELLGQEYPVPVHRVGVHDRFGESGEPQELMDKFGLRAKNLVLAAHTMMEHKTKREKAWR
ncbi:transketolase [Candidatus Saccharibacteria bacterium]|nr:MAG: transketolase [Candidatus Saccharibacteria bacterium]